MYDTYKIMDHLGKEVDKKSESGIRNMTDLDTVVKLSEAMKNFAKVEYYCTVTEAMEQEGYSHPEMTAMTGAAPTTRAELTTAIWMPSILTALPDPPSIKRK